MTVDIGVIGDHRADNSTHVATDGALGHASAALGLTVRGTWVGTETIGSDAESTIGSFDGFVIAPGSPYQDLAGVLRAIRFARESDVPLLATCGGFQHVILEYGRNVLGVHDAQHAEVDPYASELFIAPLSCSLAGTEMQVRIRPGTRAADAYPVNVATERYYCNFGLNPTYRKPLEDAGLVVSGVDADHEVRIAELSERRFFVATLFVPQTSSTPSQPHPLVTAFVTAATGSPSTGGR